MRWQERITVDPQVCHGKACIRGTRVMQFKLDENLHPDLRAECA